MTNGGNTFDMHARDSCLKKAGVAFLAGCAGLARFQPKRSKFLQVEKWEKGMDVTSF